MNINELKLSDFEDPTVRGWAIDVVNKSVIEGLSDPLSNVAVESAIQLPNIVHPSRRVDVIARFRKIYSGLKSKGVLGDLAIERQGFENAVSRFTDNASDFLKKAGGGVVEKRLDEKSSFDDMARELLLNIITGIMHRRNEKRELVLIELKDDYQGIRMNLRLENLDRLSNLKAITESSNIRGADPVYDDVVELIALHLKFKKSSEVIEILKDLQVPLEYRDAAMLEAIYRDRLGSDALIFVDKIRPAIISTIFENFLPGEDVSGSLGEAGELRAQMDFFIDRSRTTGVPIHLEFGGGITPGSMLTAYENPDSIVLSIDPMARTLHPLNLFSPSALPNFALLRGRAEEAALWAADEPYAESLMLVAPQPFNLAGLLLSAMLVVKRGGLIDVYSRDNINLNLLEELGVDYTIENIEWVEGINPPSLNLTNGDPVAHIRIRVPDFEGIGRIDKTSNLQSTSFAGFLEIDPEDSSDGILEDEMLKDETSEDLLQGVATEVGTVSEASIVTGASIFIPKIVK